MKHLTFVILYYRKQVNYIIRSIYKKKQALINLLVDALTRFLLSIFYKNTKIETSIYY